MNLIEMKFVAKEVSLLTGNKGYREGNLWSNRTLGA